MDLLQHLSRALRQYREFNPAWTELQRMTDGQLAKLGAERGDISRLAYERAEQRAGVVRERPIARPDFVRHTGRLAASAG
jgi:uncharacterized protein YjiS (DUF1127 family)